jgi:polynucleotide 5'-hydroxyl-kinase GRC3/NOL9
MWRWLRMAFDTSHSDWTAAVAEVVERRAKRIAVIGPTDVGKSHFILDAVAAGADAGRPFRVVDLDPGQKMIGAPGTAGIALGSDLERFIFLGSTSASEMSRIVKAAASLTRTDAPFLVNTAGWVRGLGQRLQAWTLAAIEPDLIVAIGDEALLAPILQGHPEVPVVRLQPSRLATRKTPSQRGRIRKAAFATALESAERIVLPRCQITFSPAEPLLATGAARPVCALLCSDGEARAIGILEAVDEVTATIFARPQHASILQLGKMWAEPGAGGWKLLERLTPSWQA